MRSVYVLGGQQRVARPLFGGDGSWYDFGKALILEVCPSTARADVRVEYVSPAQVRGADDPIVFKGATLAGGTLYVCTPTEVLLYRLPEFVQVGHVSLPCFNDLHHVRPSPEGDLLIANSGLDMVVQVTPAGAMVQEWSVLGEDVWHRFSRAVDYRKGVSTKPHRSHPNHLFSLGGDLWVTRFHQKDAICLSRPGRRIAIGRERVHDGVEHGGRIYFTTVDGHIVVVDASTLRIEDVVNLNTMHSVDQLPGWCRGILVEGDRVWVGFSRLRPTRFRENVSWVAHGFKSASPTRIGCYDLSRRECLAEIDLEPHGLNAVFGILPVESALEVAVA